ncbi:MAG: dTDP-4-dehydrorhamnose reductase [Aestuariivita sp.]|uniref:dTDP-4-dehydrorhamnose reductase n=1 Tax=Aestuariivita sp. TaxID=1872407 RepID=UPI003BAF90FF
MRVLVFGQSGQVARELAALASGDLMVLSLGRAKADLEDPGACVDHIASTDADIVINAAAYTAVDAAEEHEAIATRINGKTPGAMAEAAAARGLPFLHISTDYVFDGTGETPFKPADPTAPLSAYGRSKRAGEIAIAAAGGVHAILRTSWVFSAHGSNFVKTMLRLSESRDSLNVVDDQIGGPTPADDIARTLIRMARALKDGQGGGIYHYAGAPVASWADFARETFSQAGRRTAVQGIPSSEYPTLAARPLNSRLDCATLKTDFGITQPDWKAGLTRAIEAMSK